VKLLAIFVSLALAGAQTTPPPLKSVIGEVTAVDASAKQIKMKADDGGLYTVNLGDATSYLRIPPGEKDIKKATKIAFTDVEVGDRVLARGALTDETKSVAARTVVIMTKADLAQKHERDRAEWQKRGVSGSVTAVNPETKEITINTHARDSKPVVIDVSAAGFRRYAADSVRFSDAKPSTFADLQVGDTVRVLGDKNEDGTRFKAEELVSGSFETIAATVVSVNATTGELVVTDLKTKKPVNIQTNQNTMLRKLDERMAAGLARRMHPEAAAAGGAPGGNTPSANAPSGNASSGNGSTAGEGNAGARPPQGAPGGPGGGFAGGGGPRAGGGFDLQQMLERSPQLNLADLKKGDALIISSSKAADGSSLTAFSLVAGVEPFLAAAPRTAGQVDLGAWSIGAGMPEQ
jgi:Cu/Ag efflux protein CusF